MPNSGRQRPEDGDGEAEESSRGISQPPPAGPAGQGALSATSRSATPVPSASPPPIALPGEDAFDTTGLIEEVWADNLHDVFKRISQTVETYKYIAMDTEFPGIVVRPTSVGNQHLQEYNYQTVKGNVDLLKVIQLGLTFADAQGQLPEGVATWQFNFKFDLRADMHAHDSIEFLKQSGVDFAKHQEKGIDVETFGELIMTSGLIMNDEVKWISFHGSYDFGYLLKILTCTNLPNSEAEFFELLHGFFPSLYDIKFLLRSGYCQITGSNSLQRIAEHLEVQRIGPQHQAGSDSLVTCHTFFRLMAGYFRNQIDDSRFSGIIYGLGAGQVRNENTGSPPPAPQNNQQLTFTAQVQNPKPSELNSLNVSLQQEAHQNGGANQRAGHLAASPNDREQRGRGTQRPLGNGVTPLPLPPPAPTAHRRSQNNVYASPLRLGGTGMYAKQATNVPRWPA